MGRQSKGHAIMISVPYQGHINPYTNLALKLASKGFTVTFVHLEFVHYKLSKAHHSASNGEAVDLFSEARESGLDIRYATIGDGLPLEFDRDLHFDEYWEMIFCDFEARVDEFVAEIIRSDPYSVYFLVTDTVYTWPGNIADKYGLVNVSFWTQPALVFSLVYHWDLLTQMGHFPAKDKTEEINYIPGVKSINTKDLMSYLEEPVLSNIMARSTYLSFERVKKADFILHNTVEELEPDVISALNKYQPNYAIGPITFSRNLASNNVSKSLCSESDCTQWLESKSPASVLYVSFGSFVHTNKQIIEEIAYGLLLSEVNFIWVVRDGILDSGDASVLPVGFEDEIREKGLIVPWCNQIMVLSNPAVGGFVTHNGWNSTVESMWFGVPMICYPIACEQPTNRKLVVDDWKIGINLVDGECVERIEIAEKIKSFMRGDFISKSLMVEADKVKGKMRKALETDGSSEINFDQFIKDLEAKIHSKAANVDKLC
ncbi:UDP-glycosyltransferase 86a1 [Phtheirospermum japonicum]|uniref:UDP-glycosyltransferase 86a1 n=1 Tax=Phtheirospermum japonicum TaxID=374723 RepID=A0A830BJH1_9LAMI|nr:UDP-glycosyltransferase 86a1 [Phtheirospermum japonicum]